MSKIPSTYIAGVDGGGTGCRAAIADRSGRVLGRGEAGPANATTDAEQATGNVSLALARAAVSAGLDASALGETFAHVGLAGVIDETVGARIAGGLRVGVAQVTDDRATSIVGALGDKDGVLAAIGTGSTLAAKRGGVLNRIGGWGLNLGDQASGAWLGRALLEHALLCHDGLARHSAVTRAIIDELGGTPGSLVVFAARARPADYATFAPRVIAAAQQGDAAGQLLMQRGAAYLNEALGALGFQNGDALCLTGGIGPHYAGHLPERVRNAITAPLGNALDGALRLARQAIDEDRT